MKSLKINVFLFAMLLLVSATNGHGANWVYYSAPESDHFRAFYDSESIVNGPQGTKKVWEKWVFSESGRTDWIAKRAKSDLSTEGYEGLSHKKMLFEFNCHTREYVLISYADYNQDGQILNSYTTDPRVREWESIIPESVRETLFKIICNRQKSAIGGRKK